MPIAYNTFSSLSNYISLSAGILFTSTSLICTVFSGITKTLPKSAYLNYVPIIFVFILVTLISSIAT